MCKYEPKTLEDIRELCHERLMILKLLRRDNISAVRKKAAVPAGIISGRRGDLKKKKVRITIDTNREKIDSTLKLAGNV